MSSFRATTARPASRFTRRQYTRDTRAQLSSCADVSVLTREHASLSLHAPAVDCPRNDDHAADGGTFMHLY